MYFIALFGVAWLLFWWKADLSLWRLLYGSCVFACFLGLMTDLIMVNYRLWEYKGLPSAMFTIPLLLDFSVYPVATYLYAQRLHCLKGVAFWMHFAAWTAGSLALEWTTVKMGYMVYHLWWFLPYSACSDTIIFLSITVLTRFLAGKSMQHSGDRDTLCP